jgi:hypothetical protein
VPKDTPVYDAAALLDTMQQNIEHGFGSVAIPDNIFPQ